MSESPRPVPTVPRAAAVDRARAWLVTGSLGRALAFAIDFGAALRTAARRRR